MRAMASSSHPVFPRQPFNQNLTKLPDRSLSTAFGATSTAQAREAQRLERDRERQERERLEREGQDHMNQITEEQKEEINEAVGFTLRLPLQSLAFLIPESPSIDTN